MLALARWSDAAFERYLPQIRYSCSVVCLLDEVQNRRYLTGLKLRPRFRGAALENRVDSFVVYNESVNRVQAQQ